MITHVQHEAIIVFAKAPEAGRVKTRLTPFLSPDDAAALYAAFLADALDQYGRLDADVRLYVASGEGDEVPHIHPKQFVQRGEGLGERMLNAFAETFAAGYGRAVIVGTDHPTLPSSFIERAFQELEAPRTVVVGPAEDGGYYLLGMNDLRPALFRGITYSRSDVLSATVDRIVDDGASLAVLPAWYDVDAPPALRRLVRELADSSAAPRTRQLLAALSDRYDFEAD